jgi:hypothetical protein
MDKQTPNGAMMVRKSMVFPRDVAAHRDGAARWDVAAI